MRDFVLLVNSRKRTKRQSGLAPSPEALRGVRERGKYHQCFIPYVRILEYLNQLHGWCAKYKEGLFCIWFGPKPLVVIHSPEFAEVNLHFIKIVTLIN